MRLDEQVQVATNPRGEPIGFNWRGMAYMVSARPSRWFARREWWLEASRVQRGVGAGVVEVEMWRLTARPAGTAPQGGGGAQAGAPPNPQPPPQAQFELTRDGEAGPWRLVQVWR